MTPLATAVITGCGRTVAMEGAVASLTAPLLLLTATLRLFTDVPLFEQPLLKLAFVRDVEY